MEQVNMHQAKTHLSRLVERVEAGEEIVIARAGRPVAKLVPLVAARAPRELGRYRGQRFQMAPDFDQLPDDMLAALAGATP